MPKEVNKQIGEVECPQKGCALKASVYKFRPAGKNPNEWARRWAGKLYSSCTAKHVCRDQEYLLREAKLWAPGEAKAVEVEEPVKVEPKSEPPAQQTPPAKPSKPGDATAATRAAPTPQTTNQQRPRTGFGFFKFGKHQAET